MCTVRAIFFPHVGRSSHKDLDLSLGTLDEFLGDLQNQVHSFLFGHPPNEAKNCDVIFEPLASKVFLLKLLFRLKVIIISLFHDHLKSGFSPDSIGKGERVRVLHEYLIQWRFFEQLILVRLTNSAPVITIQQWAARWIDH